MRKFVFRLQTVLDHARKEEEALLLRLAKAQYAKTCQEQAIAAKQDERQQLMTLMASLQQQLFDPMDLHRYTMSLEVKANELVQMFEELARCSQQVQAAQQAVVEAMRKRQVLENLRDKQYDAYQHEAQRQELQTMEEAVLPRLAREQALEAARRAQKRN